jgi:hypothetical protein
MLIKNNDGLDELLIAATTVRSSDDYDKALKALQEWQQRADRRQLEIKNKLWLLKTCNSAAAA